MPINDLARRYLDHFAQGLDIPGGLPHRKALAQIRLDFSPESLDRIDLLLRQMRQRLQPEAESFIQDQGNQNLAYLLAFYIGETIARFTDQRCNWFEYEELKTVASPELLADYPYGFITSITCVFERDGFYVPLSPMFEQLFHDDARMTVAGSAQRILRRVLDKPLLLPPAPGEAAAEPANALIAEAIAGALDFAGGAAAFCIHGVLEGAALPPTLAHGNVSGKVTMVSMMDGDIDRGLKVLDTNAENAQQSALIYDGFVNLPSRRTDALVVEMRAYQPLPFSAQIVIPYRHADKPGGFALHAPRLLSFSLDAAHLPSVREGFFKGLRGFNPAGMWDKHYVTEG